MVPVLLECIGFRVKLIRQPPQCFGDLWGPLRQVSQRNCLRAQEFDMIYHNSR